MDNESQKLRGNRGCGESKVQDARCCLLDSRRSYLSLGGFRALGVEAAQAAQCLPS